MKFPGYTSNQISELFKNEQIQHLFGQHKGFIRPSIAFYVTTGSYSKLILNWMPALSHKVILNIFNVKFPMFSIQPKLPMISDTPTTPYFAVIFTSIRSAEAGEDYAQMAREMEVLVKNQPGYLGHESAREALGITVSYWESLEAIAAWKNETRHLLAQQLGKEKWYQNYKIRICKVEREYGF